MHSACVVLALLSATMIYADCQGCHEMGAAGRAEESDFLARSAERIAEAQDAEIHEAELTAERAGIGERAQKAYLQSVIDSVETNNNLERGERGNRLESINRNERGFDEERAEIAEREERGERGERAERGDWEDQSERRSRNERLQRGYDRDAAYRAKRKERMEADVEKEKKEYEEVKQRAESHPSGVFKEASLASTNHEHVRSKHKSRQRQIKKMHHLGSRSMHNLKRKPKLKPNKMMPVQSSLPLGRVPYVVRMVPVLQYSPLNLNYANFFSPVHMAKPMHYYVKGLRDRPRKSRKPHHKPQSHRKQSEKRNSPSKSNMFIIV